MNERSRRRGFAGRASVAVATWAVLLAAGSPAGAATDADIKALQNQIDGLQRAINQLKADQAQSAAQAKAAEERAAQAEATVVQEAGPRPLVTATGAPYPAQGKPPGLHFTLGGQDWQLYGRPHISVIAYNQAVKGGIQIESNQSLLGLRTARYIGPDLNMVAQIEGEFAFANSPTLKDTFGYRDTFLGFQGASWGTFAAGKHNTPYKNALIQIEPLYNTLGDVRALFGNTGGDNRVEFSLRAPHAAWYISPPVKTGLGTVGGSVLFSPGQNASSVNQDFAFGENICAGATPGPAGPFSSGTGQPGSGGTGSGRGDCNDGAFGNLASGEVHWTNAGWLISAAFEYHEGVNRLGDESGVVGVAPFPGSVGVHNETGVQVIAGRDWGNGFKTYVAFDSLNRSGADRRFNERTKKDFALMASWQVTPKDRFGADYAHATNTPGDPAFFPSNNNHADNFGVGYFRTLVPGLQLFSVAAMTVNGKTAHYDVGASGVAQPLLARGADNTVFTGKTLYGIQFGADWQF
jgi:predicted porin/outer membrane murein-binding lipoprotein Lpp